MKIFQVIASCFLVVSTFCHANGNTRQCTQMEAFAAEVVTGYLDSWKNIYLAFQEFSHCDDGAIAEGFSESVVHLLVANWFNLPALGVYSNNNPKFAAFVFGHIDSTADTDEIKIIAVLAASKCPEGFSELCENLSKASTAVIENINRLP